MQGGRASGRIDLIGLLMDVARAESRLRSLTSADGFVIPELQQVRAVWSMPGSIADTGHCNTCTAHRGGADLLEQV
jgi:hypothetical protein